MELLIILGLLIANGVFAMSEIAIVSAKKVRLEQAAERGSRGAAQALELQAQPTRFISTVQLGITLIGILLGALGERQLGARFHVWFESIGGETGAALAPYAGILSFVLVVVVVTYLSLVIGELVPKRLAMMFPDTLAAAIAPLLSTLSRATAPLVWILSRSAESLLWLVPRPASKTDEVSAEEIRGMMEQGAEAGVFHAAEHEIVDRVFRLGDLTVKSLMVPRPDIVTLDAADPPARVALVVATSPHSHFPVVEGKLEKLVGIVHVKDLVKNGLISGGAIDLRELASAPTFVPETTPAYTLLEQFKQRSTHVAMVVDEFGQVEGLITLNDLVESIVGTVARQAGHHDPEVVRREDGSLLVDGGLGVVDLENALEIGRLDVSDLGDVHTVAGLVMAVLGHVPRTGEIARWQGLRLEVVDMDRRRIDAVLVSRDPPAPATPAAPGGAPGDPGTDAGEPGPT